MHLAVTSIPPERLLKAMLLHILFTVRSERLLVESIDYNLLYRWFVGLAIDDPVWDHSTFSQNRERLFNEGLARVFFERVKALSDWRRLTSSEHFSVDGTLIDAWASHKSFRPKGDETPKGPGRNPEVDFKGKPRANDTHVSTTDPDARLFKKAESLWKISSRAARGQGARRAATETYQIDRRGSEHRATRAWGAQQKFSQALRCFCALPPITWYASAACLAGGMRSMCRAKSARIPPKGGKTAW
jgi:transposase